MFADGSFHIVDCCGQIPTAVHLVVIRMINVAANPAGLVALVAAELPEDVTTVATNVIVVAVTSACLVATLNWKTTLASTTLARRLQVHFAMVS